MKQYKGQFGELWESRNISKGNSLTMNELYTLYSSMKAIKHLEGSVAEVGVFRGQSARIICEVKGNKPMYLFDTYEGMPNHLINEKDSWKPTTFHQRTSLEQVQEYLKSYSNLIFIKGEFPKVKEIEELKNEQFCFVNLDVDIYVSTLESLKFFYPRLVPNGRLVSHNYNDLLGVKTAFNEYFKDNPEKIIEIARTQCMVIK